MNTNDSGPGSLRQAIAEASPNDTITCAPDLSGDAITLASKLGIDKDQTIDGTSLDRNVVLGDGGSMQLQHVRARRRSIPMIVMLGEPEPKGVMSRQSE